jgi:hypothetical protein
VCRHRRVEEVVAHSGQAGLTLAHQQTEHAGHEEHGGSGIEVAPDELGDAGLGNGAGDRDVLARPVLVVPDAGPGDQ